MARLCRTAARAERSFAFLRHVDGESESVRVCVCVRGERPLADGIEEGRRTRGGREGKGKKNPKVLTACPHLFI